jgi:EmrB/QacA subfamily drug resistance transporter
MLDSTVVALALPKIKDELGASAASLQWVMNGYLLTITVLVVTAGRFGDMFGRKRLFVAGMVLFAAGSALAAVADDDEVLVLARVVQGIGAAPMLSLSLAIVSHAFSRESQPGALGIWAAVSAVALAVGPLVGGALVDLDWRLIFWINLPISVVGVAIILRYAPESRDEGAGTRIDLPGLITLSAGLGATVLALVESEVWGWGAWHTLVLLGAGLALLALFCVVEQRVTEPIIDFALFRNRPYLGATAAAFALVGSYWSVMFYEPQFMQDILGHSVIASGVLILPVTAPMAVISPLSGRLIERFGARSLMTAGMLAGTAGLVLLTRISADSDYAALLPGFALFGVALALVYAPMSTAAMTAMPRAKAGIASGVLAMNRVMAGAIALAISGAIFQALRSDRLEQGVGEGEAFASALGDATWFLAALVAAGSVATWVLLRPAPRPGEAAAPPEGDPTEHHMHHRRFHL